MAAARKKTSIVIDPEIWKNAKKAAIDQNVDLSVYVERALLESLRNKRAPSKGE